MKNSKPLSCREWRQAAFLSPRQLANCRALFGLAAGQVALAVLDLPRLEAEVGRHGQALAASCLDTVEQQRLAEFTFAKRRLEWLGGRLAAKDAAIDLWPSPSPDCRDVRVDADPAGRPFLSCRHATSSLPAISISHSGQYASALAVRAGACGLDLQRIEAKVSKVRARFASSAERALLNGWPELSALGEAACLTLLWSAKEALRKAMACQPLLGFGELTLVILAGGLVEGLSGRFLCPRLSSPLAPVFLTVHNDYVCAITVVGG